ncbi:hypothetical protein ADM99_11685 [Leptolinea tardivitalis]|uniref:Uncharacterized protein n=1 Tax=Leptolinea tardivitalis TaxID=229920 RepID=A0A0P6WQA5_9CHLR|nr:hypothetical protein ADM99_11685 [Leptolinea tardivitalis]
MHLHSNPGISFNRANRESRDSRIAGCRCGCRAGCGCYRIYGTGRIQEIWIIPEIVIGIEAARGIHANGNNILTFQNIRNQVRLLESSAGAGVRGGHHDPAGAICIAISHPYGK